MRAEPLQSYWVAGTDYASPVSNESASDWFGTEDTVAATASGVLARAYGGADADGKVDLSTLQDDAQLRHQRDAVGVGEQDAGVFLTPAEEAECELQYRLDMAECSAYAAMQKSTWGVCKERAMNRYANCLRGMA